MQAPDILDPKDAVVGIVLAAMAADGLEYPAEREAAVTRVAALAPGARVLPSEFASRAPRLDALLGELGLSAFVARCVAALPPGHGREAFRAALAVASSDGRVAAVETAFLRALARALELSRAEVEQVLAHARAVLGPR